ncbi:arginine deiminase-related protein [Brachybacterium subflavum]|uniref:arginine deiminase-related protein n=1 Tax=Brachybacterium subflavum TaxID=2585206 RepID=UPI00126638CB|nr:arginine deiminase-related protein [Brachybacterium subflavum]
MSAPALAGARTSPPLPVQSPSRALLVRPHHFTANPETALDNAFQSLDAARAVDPAVLARRAYDEVVRLADALDAAGVAVTMFDDPGTATPDSVFPNNWLSTHADGTLALFPMYAPSRRAERRADIVAALRTRFHVRRVVDYSDGEADARYLEGTGAMVLDDVTRTAFACRSRRLDETLLADVCADLGLEPLVVDAADAAGVPVYHTNVLMSVGTEVAVLGASMIRDPARREAVRERLCAGGREVVELDEGQVRAFAGNCLEVAADAGPAGGAGGDATDDATGDAAGERSLMMSATAAAALAPDQLRRIERSCRVRAVEVPTIETAGGSVRCMIAGIHLAPRV